MRGKKEREEEDREKMEGVKEEEIREKGKIGE